MRLLLGSGLILTLFAAGCIEVRYDVTVRSPASAIPATPVAKAPLKLYDNFSSVDESQLLWKKLVSGAAYVQFEPSMAVLDSPAEIPGNIGQPKLAIMMMKTPVTFAKPGDTLRVTFDMQLLEDRPLAYGFGLTLGDPEGLRFGLGQFGQKAGNGTPHDLFITGPHWQHGNKIDYGTGMLHYDATFVRLSPADHPAHTPVQVQALLRVYKYEPALAANPDGYAEKPQVAVLEDKGDVPAGGICNIYFNTERSDLPGDPYTDQARGKIAITNVFVARP